jgi:hypothetical protein
MCWFRGSASLTSKIFWRKAIWSPRFSWNYEAAAGGLQPIRKPERRSRVCNFSTIIRPQTSGSKEYAMKMGKSERDLLLDQTLALVKAAIDHDSVSSSTARARQNPILSNEIAAEKIARKEQDPLVEDILSLIEHVSHEAPKATGTTWEAERLKITDDISRMTAELNTLRSRVNDFKETQQRLHRERDAPTTEAKARETPRNSPKPGSQWKSI